MGTFRRSIVVLLLAASGTACGENASGGALADSAGGRVPVTAASDDAVAAFEEGRLLQENLRRDAARERFDRAIAVDPSFALAHAYRALVSPPNEVQPFIDRAAELMANASDAERTEIQAIRHSIAGNTAAEMEVLRALADSYPADHHVLARLGSLQYVSRDYEGAAESFRRVVELAPDFGPVHNMLGYTYRELGDEAAAEQAFLDYIRTSPDEPNPYDSLGELYLDQGRYAEAREQWEQALARDPTFTVSRINIGNAHLLEGDYDAARAVYQALAADGMGPDDRVNAQNRIGDSYLHQGDATAALRAYAEAERLARENARYGMALQALYRQYMVHWMADSLDAAETVRTRALALSRQPGLSPGEAAAIPAYAEFLKAMSAVKRGDAAAANTAAEEAARLVEATGNAQAPLVRHAGLGMAAFAAGDHQGAIAHLEQGDTADPLVQYHLGLAHEALGHPEPAARHFRNVVESREIVNYGGELAAVRRQAAAKLGQ